MRQPADVFPRSVEVIAVSDLTHPVEWRALLKNVATVIHLAGITHAGPEIAEQAYDRVNRLATAELASAARAVGIGHLVFMSSIRAQSGPVSNLVLRETEPPRPTDAYGRSKLAAEEAVRAAVTYVAGMTDRFAFRQAVALLGWDPAKLPAGVDG